MLYNKKLGYALLLSKIIFMNNGALLLINSSLKKILTIFLIISISFSVGCKKGDTGPAGAVGATGATGDKGDKGDKGDTGTANVIYTSWVYATTFVDSIMDNSNVKVGHLSVPAITSDILNKGTILVYFTFGSGTYVLPYTSYAGGKANTINYLPKAGGIIISRFTHDNSNSIALSTLLQYRVIIIPGGVSGRLASTIDLQDYNAVCEAYKIPK